MRIDDSYRGENLVFLVGCPRSGTTWLQRLLSSHPRIRTGQESHLFNFYIGPQLRIWKKVLDPQATGRGGVGIGCYLTEEEFLGALRQYMNSLLTPLLAPLQAGELFLEKSPAHALFIPEIRRMLPEARFIHLIREPTDVVASLLAAARSWGAGWAPRRARSAALTWVRHVGAVLRVAPELPPGQLVEIWYEDLFQHPLEGLTRLSDFLGLSWDTDSMRRAIDENSAENARRGGGTVIPVQGAFAHRSRVVVEPDGFVRRGRPGGGREDLSWIERATTLAVTRRLRAELATRRQAVESPLGRHSAPLLTGESR